MANKTVFYRTPTTNTIPTFKLLHGGLAQYLQVLTDGGFTENQVDIYRDAGNTTVFAHLVTAAVWDTAIAAAATSTVPSVNIIDTTIADLSTQVPYLELELGARSIGSPIGTEFALPSRTTRELLPGSQLSISGTVPATPFNVDYAVIPNGADAAGRLANTYTTHTNAGEWDLTSVGTTHTGNRTFSGRCTILGFGTLGAGDVLTIGTVDYATTGADVAFTAETSDAVTAINLAAAIDGDISEATSAYATGAVVTVVQEDFSPTGAIWSVVSAGFELAIDGSGNLIDNKLVADTTSALGIVNYPDASEADVFEGFIGHTEYPLYRIRREQQKVNTTSTIDWYLVTEPYWTLLASL